MSHVQETLTKAHLIDNNFKRVAETKPSQSHKTGDKAGNDISGVQ